MIQEFPSDVETLLKKNCPPLTRCGGCAVVLNVEEIVRATANPEKNNPGGRLRNMVIQVGDLDRPSDGYDLEIEGVNFPIQREDVVTLLGHEEKGAKRVSAPRLIINHTTGGLMERAYPLAKSLDWGVLPMVERKFWLSAKTPANPAEKLKNLWIVVGILMVPLIFLAFLFGPAVVFVVLGIMLLLVTPWVIFFALLFKYLDWLEAQPRFSFETDLPRLVMQNYRSFVNFNRHDLTPLYEKLARLLHVHAVKNPAPEVEFVIVDRGVHTNGLLSAPAASPPMKVPTFVPTQKLLKDTNSSGGVALKPSRCRF